VICILVIIFDQATRDLNLFRLRSQSFSLKRLYLGAVNDSKTFQAISLRTLSYIHKSLISFPPGRTKPQFPYCSRHVRNEEDPKYAQDRIEAFGLIIQFQHIRDTEGDILQSEFASFFPRKCEESIGEINPNYESRGPD